MRQPLPGLFERIRIVKMQPPGFVYTSGFDDLIQAFRASLTELGVKVDIVESAPFTTEGVNLVFGADLVAACVSFPQNTVIVNLEQLGGRELPRGYLERLGQHPVLDYSSKNIDLLRHRLNTANAHLFKVGYVAQMSTIVNAPEQDVDVLFYGVVNERRRLVLDGIAASGLKLKVLEKVYGPERDAWIARSKLVLNMRYYESKRHEIVRTSFLLANRKAVVSECDPDTDIDDDIREAVAAVPVEQLVETCRALLADDERRHAQENRGFEIFSRRSQTDSLRSALSQIARPCPRRMNLGSGKAFDPEMLNIDVNPRWKPDLVVDMSDQGTNSAIFLSHRFGLVRLEPDMFDEIWAIDVLQQVKDLPRLMARCLDLLSIGGVMKATVPHDLSFGAWQDPTHVRAFNERSWTYYTDWYWYLGWTKFRFDVAEFRLRLSEVGRSLRDEGRSEEELVRTPRAISALDVSLRKRSLTLKEIAFGAQQSRGAA